MRNTLFRYLFISSFALILLLTGTAFGQETYKQPPKEVMDVLNAPVTPNASINPTRDAMLLVEGIRYPPIADLAQPMYRLAGLRINPATNGLHRAPYNISYTLKRIGDGTEIKIAVPANPRLSAPEWSADGKHFAFTNTIADGIELWIGDTATGKVHKLITQKINAAYGDAFKWMPDNQTILAQLIPANRGSAPPEPKVPVGPTVQQSAGTKAPVRTYEDLLTDPHDEDLFDYYATSQLAWVNTTTGAVTPFGKPAIYQISNPSPDGKLLLVARVHRPYSYLHPHNAFPKDVEVWDKTGKLVYKVANLPLEDHVPENGVPEGRRGYQWRPTDPATLVWVEALDKGDLRNPAPFRDHVLMLKAPFTGSPVEIAKTEQRFQGLQWGSKNGLAFVNDFERKKRWRRTFMINVDDSSQAPKLVWALNNQDRYHDPGRPIMTELPNGQRAILQNGDFIFLEGLGASPEGDMPFLDKFDLKTLKAERVFQCDKEHYESVVALLNDDGTKFITRRESPTEPPNYYILEQSASRSNPAVKAITQFTDPTPQLRSIKKQLVTYNRPDGVQLSFTLYLPPNYKEGTRLPTVVWAYPLEYNDADTAGQISGSTKRFTTISGPSHLFFLLEGYAVLDNATIPIVGSDPDTVNNTYLEQLVSSAKAAIDKATAMGVTDPNRVGVGGHSYGAFMTANLLAHSSLFRAGIARSGAYNRTLTPFGFQSESRTIWEAPDLYSKMSPFMYANNIKDPILLIHGEADDNSGTFPIQSERMYAAIRGNGGTARLVMLPYEAHGYAGKESIEHVLYEMINWFDEYVKNAEPRTAASGKDNR